jgi:hypothetical protein
MEHPSYTPELTSNDFSLFAKIRSAVKGRSFWDIEDIRNKCDDGTESCPTIGVPEMFPIVAASLV